MFDRRVPLGPRDVYVGRERGAQGPTELCPYGNPYLVKVHGRKQAVELYKTYLYSNPRLLASTVHLKGKRLLCHCAMHEECHRNILAEAAEMQPDLQEEPEWEEVYIPKVLVIKVGLPWSPEEFLSESLNAQHPFDSVSGVSDTLLRSIYDILTGGPEAMKDKRKKALQHVGEDPEVCEIRAGIPTKVACLADLVGAMTSPRMPKHKE